MVHLCVINTEYSSSKTLGECSHCVREYCGHFESTIRSNGGGRIRNENCRNEIWRVTRCGTCEYRVGLSYSDDHFSEMAERFVSACESPAGMIEILSTISMFHALHRLPNVLGTGKATEEMVVKSSMTVAERSLVGFT